MGSIVALVIAVVIAIIGAATRWPWHWWIWAIVCAICVVVAVFAYLTQPQSDSRKENEPRSAFVVGDASGSSFNRVFSNADDFIRGNALRAIFRDVTHRSPRFRRK